MKLTNLRIPTRLFIGFGVPIVGSAVLLAAALVGQQRGIDQTEAATLEGAALVARAAELGTRLNRSAIATRNMGLSSELEVAYKHQRDAESQLKAYLAGIDDLKTRLADAESQQLLEQLRALEAESRKHFVEAVGLMAALSTEAAVKEISDHIDPGQRKSEQVLEALSARVGAITQAQLTQVKQQTRNMTLGVLAFGVLCISFVCLFAWRVARSISVPLADACRAVDDIAAGKLDGALTSDARDETGQLLRGIDAMRLALATMVQNVRTGAQVVADATAEMASGNLDLSNRTERQAAALQQAAATMQQLESAVRNTAQDAARANDLAAGARTQAQSGGEIVNQAVVTMRDVQDSSRKIADITNVINGIAFQTNILALNAAVEAARAGDQGRGFAVVAAEVRTLAHRSAEAAKQIKTLIDTSVERIDNGTKMVERTGSTMVEIVSSIHSMSEFADTIRKQTHDQSEGLTEVGMTVRQLDEMTHQGAAFVEQNAAAADSLKHQAAQLVSSVAAFKLVA